MAHVVRHSATVSLILLLTSAAAWAQATAQFNGRVTDESGAVLPGVSVTVTQTDTGFTRSVVTDGNGLYVMPNVPTGPYRLEVSLQGFRTYAQTGIVLQVGTTPTINASLAVGNLEETVSVEAATPLVDVRSAGVSEVVDQGRILELPLQGRQVTDLIVLAGASVQTGAPDAKNMPGSVGMSIAGGLPIGVAYQLDGAMHNNPYDNRNMPFPFPDALQEFSVATSGLTAEHGSHSGGSVSAVTKSGTNRFSGNVFEFVRDRRFNATRSFAPVGSDGKKVDDGMTRNQFGGTLGGPIATDKLFFFGGYQGTALRLTPADRRARVPTAAMLAGDFTAFASPACQARPTTLRAPFVNNRVDRALFSPVAMNIAKHLPSTDDPCGEVTYSTAANADEGQAVARMDYQRSANHSLFGRYMFTYNTQPPAWPESGNVLTTLPADNFRQQRAHSLAVGDTRVFGANTVNAFRVAWNRSKARYHLEPFFGAENVGVKNFHNYVPGIMHLAITGGFETASGGSVFFQGDSDAYQVSNDLTLVRGGHQMGVGAALAYWKHDTIDAQRGVGQWRFTGAFTGLGMADFLLGNLFEVEQAAPGVLDMSQRYLGLYAQDTWRVSGRVTLNAGLRWEPFFGQNVLNNAITNFSLDNFRQGVRSTVFRNAPAGLIYPGDPGFPSGNSGMSTQWWNLSPRVGVAWDVTGDSRTAVRSSYGIAYDFMIASYFFIAASAPPFGNRLAVLPGPGGLEDPYRDWPGTPPHPTPAVPGPDAWFPEFGAYGVIDPDINSPRVQSWNAIVERQIGSDWGATVSYLGSYTDRIWGQAQRNPGVFLGLGPCTINEVFYPTCSTNSNLNQRRVLSLENPELARDLGPVDRYVAVGTQDYHALRLSFQRRAASGLSLNGNYTRTYCVGNDVATAVGGRLGQIAGGFSEPDNSAADRGSCSWSRRHIANLTVGIQTPQFANAALHALASDWRVAGILNARSGDYLTVTTARDTPGTGIRNQRPDQVLDNPYGDKTLRNYLNAAAFAHQVPGTQGNHRFNGIEGPGFWTVQLALSRLLSVGDGPRLELRIEVFNLLNHFNWGNPVTDFDSGTFGQIRSQTGDPRIVQFGVKYGF